MEIKTYRGRIDLKASEKGEFTAAFAALNVIDHDGDVTLPGAFGAQRVLIEPWNHNYEQPPVGKGTISEEGDQALVTGKFFLDTQAGKDHYTVVKELADMQEWSYSFYILDAEPGTHEGQAVRLLKRLDVIGVGPVARGAGIGTHTVDIKGMKPYPNEHACRLREPGDFQADTFVRTSREHEGKRYDVIQGRLKGETTLTDQAYRYPKDTWTADAARAHCQSHDGISFEPAEGEVSAAGCPLCKAGARHTSQEYKHLQAIHDLAVELGAKCAEEAETDSGDDQAEAGDGKARNLRRVLSTMIEIEEMEE